MDFAQSLLFKINYLSMSINNLLPENVVNSLYFLKPILTFEEGCEYTGLSKSKMYKHTSSGNIPFYKPEGKKIYFKTEDLNNWMLRNRSASNEEIERSAAKQSLMSH